MTEYDFRRLNDKEFEILVSDLLTKERGHRIERFKAGRDAGVDGRYFSDNKHEVIIQCKHWIRSGITALIHKLKGDERPKVEKLKPSSYIFATSLELSRVNKKEIACIFAPYIKNERDIYGYEDLNQLLSLHPEIEKNHYKLWMPSSNILNNLLNSGIINKSTFKLDEITTFIPKYVQTQSHIKARDKLDSKHSLIITGEPGIGKTKLAEQLCLSYALDNYQLYSVDRNLDDAFKVFDKNKKQVFYFDDFLGRNYLQALDRNEDSQVIQFMRRTAIDKNKRFILTSRTSVLNQGKKLSDLFEIENIHRNEYEICVDALSNLDKAKILYNHIYFSDLKEEFVDELYLDKRYMKIINHQNFNPRLIQFITDIHKLTNISAPSYWNHVIETLKNPAAIWANLYDNHMDDLARACVAMVTFNNHGINETNLIASYERYIKDNDKQLTNISQDFTSTSKLIVGSMLNRSIDRETGIIEYSLFNPSIGDFLVNKYRFSQNYLLSIFKTLRCTDALRNLNSLKANKLLKEASYDFILIGLVQSHLNPNETATDIPYLVSLAYQALQNKKVLEHTRSTITTYIKNLELELMHYADLEKLFELIFWGLEEELITFNGNLIQFIELNLNYHLDHETYLILSKIIKNHDQYNALTKLFVESAIAFWEDNYNEYVFDNQLLSYYYYDDDYEEACETANDELVRLLGEYEGLCSNYDLGIIENYVDIDSQIESNRESVQCEENFREDPKPLKENFNPAIDDLFSREH